MLSLLVENAAIKLVAIGAGRIDGESTLFSLTESGLLSTLVVQPFDAAGVRFLAEELTSGTLTEGAVETIRQMTGGNPSFVKAFVQSCLDQGILVRDSGSAPGLEHRDLWLLARLSPEPDEGLIELVREMHLALPERQQRILDLLALGGPEPRELLVACGGGDFRYLVESGILAVSREGLVGIRAEIHASVLRHGVPPGRSTELYGQWATHRAELGIPPTPLQVLWALEIGARTSADEVMNAVARANNDLDYALAWKLCAVAGLSAESESGMLLEARTLLGLGRYYSARALLMGLAGKTNDPTILQRALNMLFMVLVQLGLDDHELDALEQLWEERSSRPGNHEAFTAASAQHRRTNELLALWRRVQDADTEELPIAEAQRILANPELAAEGRAIALLVLSDLHSIFGRTETALGLARQAMSELDQDPSLAGNYQLSVLVRIGWNLVLSGRYDEADEFLAAHRGATVRLQRHRHGSLSLVRGVGELLRGRSGRARRALAESIADFRLHDPSQLLPLALALDGFAERRVRNVLSVRMPTARDDHRQQPGAGAPASTPGRLLVRVIAAGAEGSGSDTIDRYPLLAREVLAGSSARLLGTRKEAQEFGSRLHELASGMEGQRSAFLARMADPQLAGDAPAAETLAREARDAGEFQVAAESLARAATLFSAAGESRRCGAILRELMELVRERELTPDAYVARALALAELTTREEEIVELARLGKNNAEIARALTVSQRTVEGHLYRVFSKLGIAERSELAGLRLYAGTQRGQNA
ncbi:response regulator transcription factor [Arthrobacter sp. JSM 101049]|uniref:helix-turn-helix transcriptional regulator n=1 Tax=Arthrobacter sp. JSM 101049 TaxID=929097 RepID=UPI003565E07B